jgi:hypothetical protein
MKCRSNQWRLQGVGQAANNDLQYWMAWREKGVDQEEAAARGISSTTAI